MQFAENLAIDLLKLRHSQMQLNEHLKSGKFGKIPVHLAIGREAVAIGIASMSSNTDVLCLTHRNIAHNLSRTQSLTDTMSHLELCSSTQGLGETGSMNYAAFDFGIAYSSSILGNNLPVAAGISLNRQLLSDNSSVIALTGDGAIEEGVFWETLIFSKANRLNLIIVIENDNFSMSSKINERRANINLRDVSSGLGIEYFQGDGACLAEVTATFAKAQNAAKKGQPSIVEYKVHTFCNHAGPTPGWPDDPKEIDLQKGLVIAEDLSDPVYKLRKMLGNLKFDELVNLAIRS